MTGFTVDETRIIAEWIDAHRDIWGQAIRVSFEQAWPSIGEKALITLLLASDATLPEGAEWGPWGTDEPSRAVIFAESVLLESDSVRIIAEKNRDMTAEEKVAFGHEPTEEVAS